MLNDLRHIPKADGFQLIDPDLAVILLVIGTVLGYVLGAWK